MVIKFNTGRNTLSERMVVWAAFILAKAFANFDKK